MFAIWCSECEVAFFANDVTLLSRWSRDHIADNRWIHAVRRNLWYPVPRARLAAFTAAGGSGGHAV